MKPREYRFFMSNMEVSRRTFLRVKRRQSVALLHALSHFRDGCAYLPPAEDHNGGQLIRELEDWIEGPCREAWKKS